MGAAQFVLLSTDVGKELALDQQVSTLEAFGQTISDERTRRWNSRWRIARYTEPHRHDVCDSSVHAAQLPASCT